MAPLRTPFQGVWNVVRFNWHFYALALAFALALSAAWVVAPPAARPYVQVALGCLLVPIAASLAASAYVYDCSNLYRLDWLPTAWPAHPRLLSVSAGFDEISPALQRKYSPADLLALDFYDPARHTEVSIRRARRAYAPFPGTKQVDTRGTLPAPNDSMDLVFAFLSAHEIRDAEERAAFFRELQRVVKPTGAIIVTEHLRDPANFLAYSIGFLHFHSRRAWHATYRAAGLRVQQEINITPFITSFVLGKNGSSA